MATSQEVVIAVMTKVRSVGKDGVNQVQNFKFRGIDAVVNAVGPALRDVGGFIVPTVMESEHSQGTTAKGGVLNTVRLEVAFSIYGSEGDPVTGVVSAEAFDSGDKATAKAMSVAFRTFMLQVFCLPTDEPDPDADSYKLGVPDKIRDYLAEGIEVKDVDVVRLLWGEASKAGAAKEVLDGLVKRAEELTAAGERDRISASILRFPA